MIQKELDDKEQKKQNLIRSAGNKQKSKEIVNRSYDAKMLITREAEANDIEDDQNSSANQNMTALNT